jgi:hypothetical protein
VDLKHAECTCIAVDVVSCVLQNAMQQVSSLRRQARW